MAWRHDAASTACTSASIAVEAVTRGGRPVVMRGSSTATCGCRSKRDEAHLHVALRVFDDRHARDLGAGPRGGRHGDERRQRGVRQHFRPAVLHQVVGARGQHDARALRGVEHRAAADGHDTVAAALGVDAAPPRSRSRPRSRPARRRRRPPPPGRESASAVSTTSVSPSARMRLSVITSGRVHPQVRELERDVLDRLVAREDLGRRAELVVGGNHERAS